MSKGEKSRDISLTELYSVLQNEYISYFLRKKLYCKEFSINYETVCRQKQEKIEKISLKNSLPSIFNDEEMKERYLTRFLNETGAPNFTYKDEVIKNKMERWDNYYYFAKGSSVKFLVNDKIMLGVVAHNDKDNRTVLVKDEIGKEHSLHYLNITRLFPQDFFEF